MTTIRSSSFPTRSLVSSWKMKQVVFEGWAPNTQSRSSAFSATGRSFPPIVAPVCHQCGRLSSQGWDGTEHLDRQRYEIAMVFARFLLRACKVVNSGLRDSLVSFIEHNDVNRASEGEGKINWSTRERPTANMPVLSEQKSNRPKHFLLIRKSNKPKLTKSFYIQKR